MVTVRKGTTATQRFYDRVGWTRDNGVLVDQQMFAFRDGPIRQALEAQRLSRVQAAACGPAVRLVELGCGGNPAIRLAARCAGYTGVDFSSVGLAEASSALKALPIPAETVESDITELPFPDGTFDVAYSAHAIYHIDTIDGQRAAFREALRVVAPGGRAVFILANPFPLFFPLRLLRRVLAMTPGVRPMLDRLRAAAPVPYLPMPLSWMRRELRAHGDVTITGYAIPSVAFDRRVSEQSMFGRAAWKVVQYFETRHPQVAARLGCYVLIVVNKRG